MLKRRWIFTIFRYRSPQWKKNGLIARMLGALVKLRVQEESRWNRLPLIQVASIGAGKLQRGTCNHSWQWINHNYPDLISHCPRVKEVICLYRGAIDCFVWAITYKAKVKVWWWKIKLDIINPPVPMLLIWMRVLYTTNSAISCRKHNEIKNHSELSDG